MTRRFVSALTAGGATGIFFCCSPALADVDMAWADAQTYTYSISHVTDLDQRRFLVPSLGSNYCVPTAAMNWMAYFANHGATWLQPLPGNWLDPDLHIVGSTHITNMGDLMSTDPLQGTNGTGTMAGLNTWLVPTNIFSVTAQFSNTTWTPGAQDAAVQTLLGGYIMLGVGWYQEFVFDPDYIERGGGHELSVVSGARSGSNMEIAFRDPSADEGSMDPLRLLQQSPYRTHEFEIDRVYRQPGLGNNHRYMDKLVGYGNQGYIDSVIAIRPHFALTVLPDSAMYVTESSQWPVYGGVIIAPGGTEIPAGGGSVVDFSLAPDLSTAYAVVTQPGLPGQLLQLGLGNVVAKPMPISGITNPTATIMGRLRGLYVLNGENQLVLVNMDLEEPETIAVAALPLPCQAMTYDDATDEVVLFSASHDTLLRYPSHLDALPTILPLVPGIGADPATVRMQWDPLGGQAWVCSTASNSLYRMDPAPFGGEILPHEMTYETLINPKAVDFSDGGRMFVSSEDVIKEFDYNADTDQWWPADAPSYAGVAAGDFLQVSRNSSNWDPALDDDPAWFHIAPEFDGPSGTLDCAADVDGNGDVGFGDLIMVLAAWGPCPEEAYCESDFDFSGDVGFSDLLILLAGWGPCP